MAVPLPAGSPGVVSDILDNRRLESMEAVSKALREFNGIRQQEKELANNMARVGYIL